MEKEKRSKKLANRLKNKYRLVILNDDSFEENFSLRLSPLNVISWGSLIMLILIVVVTGIISFTPLREYIPGYSDVETKRNAAYSREKADSLQVQLDIRDQWIENVRMILSGEIPADSIQDIRDTTGMYADIQDVRSPEDSAFRKQVEQEEAFSLNPSSTENAGSSLFFFTPIKGAITSRFNEDIKHFGVDVSAREGEAIKAVNDGTVIFAEWTSANGHVIQIQHGNRILSVYKHCSQLLKKSGDRVIAGEAIAIVGNTGENSTGPHLHFELWESGKPIDPLTYISF